MGGCKTEEIVTPQDLFGVYDGRGYGAGFRPKPPLSGNCYGSGMRIEDRGNNEIYLFAGCDIAKDYSKEVIPRFDNLRIGKTLIDTISYPSYGLGTFLLKNITYGLFNKNTGKQVGYIAFQRRGTATNPPVSYTDTYYLYVPFIISSNTKDTLTHYFGQRILKEVTK